MMVPRMWIVSYSNPPGPGARDEDQDKEGISTKSMRAVRRRWDEEN